MADGAELTGSHTGSTLDALALIDDVWFFAWDAADAVDRAGASASRALLALLRIDVVLGEGFADMGWALLVLDVSKILIIEVSHGAADWVGSGLTKGAKGVVLGDLGKILEFFKGLEGAAAFDDLGEELVDAFGTDTAWGALTAGLVADEVHIELSDVDHAVVFVHDDGAAGAHHGATGD